MQPRAVQRKGKGKEKQKETPYDSPSPATIVEEELKRLEEQSTTTSTSASPAASPAPSASSSAPSQPAAAFLPRSLAPRTKTSLPRPSVSSISSISSTSRAPSAPIFNTENLEALVYTVECASSEYGLALYHSKDLAVAFKESKDGYIHIQHLLLISPVRALTHTQAELQAALKSRPSQFFTVSEDGFRIKLAREPDWEALLTEKTNKAAWSNCMLYFENVTAPPGPASASGPSVTSALSISLSTLLKSPIQRLSLPPLPYASQGTSTNNHGGNSQDDAYRASTASAGGAFPTGGGQFRGFCFVIVESEEVAMSVLKKWKWDKEEGHGEAIEVDEEEEEKKARESGFRALSLHKYNELLSEYNSYRTALQRTAHLKPPAPPQPADAGAYPIGCILWVRNIHPKSRKLGLQDAFRKLLEDLQEGSGKGIEFVDLGKEKGTDQCHLRFSSLYLANLVLNHLSQHPTLHVNPHKFIPFPSATSSSPSTSKNDSANDADIPTRPLAAQLLTGPREKLYWSNLPEAARRSARASAKGTADLEKAPRLVEKEGEERKALEREVNKEERGSKRSLWDGPEGLEEPKRKKPLLGTS